MKIRKAKICDAEKIAQNNVLMAKESEKINIEFKTTFDAVKNLISHPKNGFYVIVEDNNEILGQLMITFEWSDWRNKQIWWIQSVYISKKMRRKGIFKNLFGKIKEMADDQNVVELRLYVHNKNTNAIETYDHVGMKQAPYKFFQLNIQE